MSGTHIGEETRKKQNSLKYRWERGAFHLLMEDGPKPEKASQEFI